MKVLCICQKGNMRSVALAHILKTEHKLDAIAMGICTSSPDTQKMLFEWCDVMILTSKRYIELIPLEYRRKLKVWHVGTDRWFNGYPSDLTEKFREFISQDLLGISGNCRL
jgi:hypothetical protein